MVDSSNNPLGDRPADDFRRFFSRGLAALLPTLLDTLFALRLTVLRRRRLWLAVALVRFIRWRRVRFGGGFHFAYQLVNGERLAALVQYL